MTSQLLGLGLRKMKQPKVIAEVLGGILLGALSFLHSNVFFSHSLTYIGPTAFGPSV